MKTIKKAIQESIDREQASINIYDIMVETFRPFEGKPISKRFETALKKALPNHHVSLSNSYNMYHMIIWSDRWEDRYSFLLGYFTNPIYRLGVYDEQHSGFAYYSSCYGEAAKIRNADKLALLSDKKRLSDINKVCLNFIKAKKAFDDLNNFKMPAYYDIKRAYGIE